MSDVPRKWRWLRLLCCIGWHDWWWCTGGIWEPDVRCSRCDKRKPMRRCQWSGWMRMDDGTTDSLVLWTCCMRLDSYRWWGYCVAHMPDFVGEGI